ncbi:MAG: DUF2207 domain-containing protein [Defluviitaleaceae bacterium]|nr:DUF2207 domain-containing protein [Defluviitaleaceae bacterium]
MMILTAQAETLGLREFGILFALGLVLIGYFLICVLMGRNKFKKIEKRENPEAYKAKKEAAKAQAEYLRKTKKQRIKTKEEIRIKQKIIKTIMVALIVFAVAVCGFYFIFSATANVGGTMSRTSPEVVRLLLLEAIAFSQCFLGIFIIGIVIYSGIQKGRVKTLREKSTFRSSQGIVYYRDFLKGVTPADMSILMNLKIDDRKDITATILRLCDKKVIDFAGNRMVFSNQELSLDKGESELLHILKNGGINPTWVKNWKSNRFLEAKEKGFVKDYVYHGDTHADLFSGCVGCLPALFLMMLFMMGAVFCVNNLSSLGEIFFSFEEIISQTNVKDLTSGAIYLNGMMFCTNMIVIIPVFLFSKFLGRANDSLRNEQFLRTPQGDELAEKIAGLKRFINEFSVLSEAEKEKIVLWNDFLVYAVVLEENTRIVNDIGKLYKKEHIVNCSRGIY